MTKAEELRALAEAQRIYADTFVDVSIRHQNTFTRTAELLEEYADRLEQDEDEAEVIQGFLDEVFDQPKDTNDDK